MNSPASTIPALRVAGVDDVDLVADIVADAFESLDVIRFLVPEQTRRWQVSRAWYRLYIAHAIDGAGHVVVTEDHSAAAVWFDRTGTVTEPDRYAERLAELAGDALPRFHHLDKQMDAHHPADPHWHLLFLAVRPPMQNYGLGSRLLTHANTRLDADGIPAYLEATNTQNQHLYHRHGYTDMNPPTIDVADNIPLYRMWRPAGTD